MKTFLIFAIACGLMILGPGPISLCSLLSSMNGECASSETHSQCEGMDTESTPSETVAALSQSCCPAVQAPLPELRNEVAKIAVQVIGVVSADTGEASPIPEAAAVDVPIVDSYPPRLQSVLCTFLI